MSLSPLPLPVPEQWSLPLEVLVRQALLPQLDDFCERLLREGRAMQIDATPVFSGRDKFLPGKIAIGMSYLLRNAQPRSAAFARYLEGFRRIAELTLEDDNDSWGIYYYASALHKLQAAGLLEAALPPEVLARLRQRLDWRSFVRATDYTLIALPTNYYGVAFSIARLRYLLGWESAEASEILLQKTVQHYQNYSGEFGFSDETDGEGRFDRYSILLIGEICQRFLETGLMPTEQIKAWLRRSAELILLRLNPAGAGFEFGRSIGAYGDTAFVEVLAAAARLDVLSAEEKALAYAFSVRATARYAEFWCDPAMGSVNLWEKGRRTDAYRGKHRILGENLSLLHQFIYTSEQWREMGFAGRPPMPAPDFEAALARLPRFTTTWFARGEFDRALITFRDGQRVLSLPVINGGISQHAHNPYFSIPFSSGLVQGAADAGWPQLMPRFRLEDGSVLIPAAFQRQLQTRQDGRALELSWWQSELDRVGAEGPVADPRLTVETHYRLDSGVITRSDCYTPLAPLENVDIELEFASFSRTATLLGHEVRFADGEALSFVLEGLPECRLEQIGEEAEYRAPTGPFHTRVRYVGQGLKLDRPFTLRWTLRYR